MITGVREIALRILIDDFDRPSQTILFLSSASKEGVSSSSSEYKEALRKAELWYGRVILLMES